MASHQPATQGNLFNEVSEIKQSLNQLREHVRLQDKHIAQCLKNEKETATLLLKLQRDHSDLVKYTGSLEEFCLELDTKCRKKHLILTGVTETPAESKSGRGSGPQQDENESNEMETEENNFSPTHAAAFTVLQSIYDILVYDDIDVAYRVGRKGSGPRPILVKFVKEQTRNEVNRRRTNLKDSDETKTLFLNEDLPAKINERRAELRCIVDHAKSRNIHAKSMGNRISVDNKVYTHQTIDKLPQGLKISDAKMIDTVKGLAFQSEYAFLSNFYPSPIKYNGLSFPTAEHAYQFTRATFLGKHDSAYEIKVAKRPQAAKREGAKLLSTREWDNTKVKTMREIIFSKFAQNPNLQQPLIATGERPLLEATYDSFWGCGLPLSARKLKQGDWHGRNQLGLLLVECRSEILKERAAKGLSFDSTIQRSNNTDLNQQVVTQPPPQGSPQPRFQAPLNKKQSAKQTSMRSPKPTLGSIHQTAIPNQSQQPLSMGMSQQHVFNQALGHNNQQLPIMPNQMLFPPPNFAFSNPYFMYPQMQIPFMPAPTTSPEAYITQFGSPTNNFASLSAKHTSPVSTVSDSYNHGDRRLSFDPNLSPVIHV